MKYNDSDLLKLQSIEKEVLSEIIRVCDILNIEYFTVGGTTLGAIRHSDFIPWDDDIDIGMMRNDYEIFLQKAPELLKTGYYLQSFYSEPNMPTYFAKVRKQGTRFVENYAKEIDMNHGIYVDIMPYDFLPEKQNEKRKYKRILKLWWELYIAKSINQTCMTSDPIKKSVGSLIRGTMHLLLKPISKQWLFNHLDKQMRSYNDSGSQIVSSRGYTMFECSINDIFPTRKHPFGNLSVNVPNNAEKVLAIQYGDFMKLPPEDKRVNHAPTELYLG